MQSQPASIARMMYRWWVRSMDVTITVSTSFSWIICSNSSLCAADSGTVGQGRRGRGSCARVPSLLGAGGWRYGRAVEIDVRSRVPVLLGPLVDVVLHALAVDVTDPDELRAL